MSDNILQKTHLLARYTLSGAAAAVVHFALLIALVELFSINPTLASVLGFIAAIFINYNLQYHWTFADRKSGSHRVVFVRYLVVTLFTLSINTLLFWVMNEAMGLQYLYAQLIATATVLLINFVINHKYTFK